MLSVEVTFFVEVTFIVQVRDGLCAFSTQVRRCRRENMAPRVYPFSLGYQGYPCSVVVVRELL
jgi:hypothetical protein